MDAISWTHLKGSGTVSDQPTFVHGVIVTGSSGGATASVYNGQDAESGNLLSEIKVAANLSWQITFPQPLYCNRGVYVKFGSNITSVTVFWRPAPALLA